MSLAEFRTSWLTLRPRIRETSEKLEIRDPWLVRLCWLFTYMRCVEIIPVREVLIHRVRLLWFFKQETILPYSVLSHLNYDFAEQSTSWGFSLSGGLFGAQDSVEKFMISVTTEGRDEYEIGVFHGEGAVSTGWSGTLLGGDSAFDFAGTQEGESRQFANYLSELLGIPIGKQYFGAPKKRLQNSRRRC